MSETQYEGEFSVCQFFENEQYEYVKRFVPAEEAVKAFHHYTRSVSAQIGTTKRVIITDGGDSINAEWIFKQGFTFPPEFLNYNKENPNARTNSN